MTDPVDVLVIGAGPAGSAAAALLHWRGFSVRVVEQAKFPRFVIGESLLPHCMDTLDEAGLLEAAKSRNYMVKAGALFARGDERADFWFADQFTRGWSWTWQVPRADFDHTLAEAVAAMGVEVRYQTSVVAVDFSGPPRVTVRDAGGDHEMRARFVVDASGYGRVLPRLLALEEPSSLPPRTALFTHLTGDRRPPGRDEGRIWVCVHPDGNAWVWVIPFSDGRTSLGVVGAPEFFARYPSDPEARLRAIVAGEPNSRARLEDARYLFQPAVIQNYSCAVKQLHGPGYCLVGNATEFLDPIFSSGVNLGLKSSSLAAGSIARELRGEPADWERDYAVPMRRGTDVFRTFVTRWYDGTLVDLILAPRPDKEIGAQICSILAGYVWDLENPIVRAHSRRIPQLVRLMTSGRAI